MSIPTSISVRWGIAAGAAAILFALLFVSFNVFGQTTHPCDARTARTDDPPDSGVIVPDLRNTGLVADCKVLWELKDTLRGTAPLNWDSTTRDNGLVRSFHIRTHKRPPPPTPRHGAPLQWYEHAWRRPQPFSDAERHTAARTRKHVCTHGAENQ